MASRVETDDENDNNKGSMWVLDQKLDQPMDEEAGRLRNMYREKVRATFFSRLSLTY
jgi:KUP system potassium uptake protein